jgi:hypothetical protein
MHTSSALNADITVALREAILGLDSSIPSTTRSMALIIFVESSPSGRMNSGHHSKKANFALVEFLHAQV